MLKKFLCCIFITLMSTSCYAENHLLILGDSLSANYGLGLSQGWTTLLQNRLKEKHFNYKVINASISGNTTSNGLSRLPKLLNQYQPKITIIELGGNDAIRGLKLSVTKDNLTKIILTARKSKSQPILVGLRIPPNYGIDYTNQFQAIYSSLAKKYNVPLVPLFLMNVDSNPNLMQPDGIHPTADAQPIILENIWKILEPLLHSD